ncbi:MAG TPA: helix-turn-helix domain-containing protein, partial [Methyloceanibacter sp.]
MPTEPTRAPVNPPEASDGRRLHIHGIKEMPAGYDAEVAELFRDLRAASNLSEADLAATLATRTEVVQALEQGALYALPPWPETSRVVNSYGLLLNLDVRPLLRRIYAQIEPSSTGQDPYAMA